MSHKGKNSAGSAKGKKPAKSGAESKGEDVLQAVVRPVIAGFCWKR
jgi:translation initiation factor eIF-2B subunit epsilon